MSNPIIPHDEPAPDVAGTTGTTGTDGTKKRDWLELPRNITLTRFVNTRRETHFIGQYCNPDPKSGDTNPRRIYTIEVLPMWDEDEERDSTKAFEVSGLEDGKLLFRVTTMRGRAVAEYLGVKALKAWLNYCGSKRRGKQSLKNHNKRYRANRRARKAAMKEEV